MTTLTLVIKAAQKLINQRLKKAPKGTLKSYFVKPKELWHKYPDADFITPEEAHELKKTESNATYF